jgi:hypothetical protein
LQNGGGNGSCQALDAEAPKNPLGDNALADSPAQGRGVVLNMLDRAAGAPESSRAYASVRGG